ncbi:MAG: UDP-N-acetylmuramate dehydrogenase [Bacteroidales bacterium]|jgi:UDP-N-acetylmuramate dehydrogenase|nr:UDP-N-acetylmuramate dehydrogenase [Bacteroidales bacterium]MDD3914532.1 UDP-N-acetylmuramate dehydrogenase [Bacteroidales bacterium]MDD4634426.1 UDP-N-acetylmuramate dehydrogenase [Bacteroidales bacterium]
MITIQENFSLKNYNTLRVDVKAKYFADVHCVEELQQLLSDTKFLNTKKMVLGLGANVLFMSDFDGLIINVNINYYKIENEDDTFVNLSVGAGVVWNDFVKYCLNNSYFGAENLIGIPSLCGSAVVQNIGAYGAEVGNIVESVKVIEIDKPVSVTTLYQDDCCFEYRNSIFKKNIGKYCVTEVTLKLNKIFSPVLTNKEVAAKVAICENITAGTVADAVMSLRTSKLVDYKSIPNAGSFFKNPVVSKKVYENVIEENHLNTYQVDALKNDVVKLSAAQLIEKAGYKGYRKGSVGISEKHALILCNYGADGLEVYDFAQMIIAGVKEMFNVKLEFEVVVV